MSQTTVVLFFFLLFVSNGEEVQSGNQTGKVTWSITSPCKHCVHIAMCPVICGRKVPTTPQPKPTTKPPPTKLPFPTAPPVIPSPQPLPPLTPAPTIQPPLTPAPPVIVPTQTPVPPPPGELSCQVTFEKKGCFKDDQKPPRPLPNYILTDRDSSLKIYSGKEIDWANWVNYLPDFVCRCAQLAKSKNFKFFGIQYYGECWSGPSQDENLFKKDGSSTECVNTEWKQCSDQSKLACAGKELNNYVYAIV